MIGSVTKVLSRNISIKSFKFTGIFDPSKSPPTSDIYTSCVTDTQAIINFVISLVIVLAAKTDGNSISAKPTINVWDAAAASGTWRSFKIGMKGVPNTWNIVVYSAIAKANVARHITTGKTPNHISNTFLNPSLKNSLTLEELSAFSKAFLYPHEKELYPSGIVSKSSLTLTF